MKQSVKQITKAYEKLLIEVKNDDFYQVDLTNRVNNYLCKNGHITKTKDVDAGVTPFMTRCFYCDEMAKSTFYNDYIPTEHPVKEFYRPTLKETLKLRQQPNLIDHILKGGLIERVVYGVKNHNKDE